MKEKGIIAILVAVCLLAVTAIIIPVQTDHTLSAEVTGSRALPIIDVRGDGRTGELLDLDVTSLENYHGWISKNITEGKALPAFEIEGCSAFSVKTDDGVFAGRNLDFTYLATTGMIVKYTPLDGYRSIGFASWLSVFDPLETFDEAKDDIRARAAPMVVSDGMNEKGLMCALLVTKNEPISCSCDNSWFPSAMVRYMLDHVATVDEAISVLEKKGYSNEITIKGALGRTVHAFITDADGNSLVVESTDGKLFLTVGKDANVLTNHCLNSEAQCAPSADSMKRYQTLKSEVIEVESQNHCTIEKCKQMLKSVAKERQPGKIGQSYTRWSQVYDIDNRTMYIWFYCYFDAEPVVLRISDMCA